MIPRPRLIQRVLGPEGTNHQLKVVRDRVAAQLLMRRQGFNLVIIALDRPDQEAFFRPASNRTQQAAGISASPASRATMAGVA